MWKTDKYVPARQSATYLGWRVAASALVLCVHLPAHAQRYEESDYSGSLNLVIWAIFIVAALFMWLRKVLRHWWNPEKAEAEDKAAEAKRQADIRAMDERLDARMAEIAKESAKPWNQVLPDITPKKDEPRPGSFAELQKKVGEKSRK